MHKGKEQIAIAKLVEGLKAGEPESFKEIFILFEQKLYRFVFSITKSEYISEEIIQEVFLKIWEGRTTLNPTQSFDSFLFTITRNLTYNYLRNASRRKSIRNELWANIVSQQQQPQADVDLIFEEYKEIVEDIVRNLPQQKKSVYQLSRQQGKSITEIAEILDISPKTVKNHLWNTMRIIRSQLRPYLEDSIRMLIIYFIFSGF